LLNSWLRCHKLDHDYDLVKLEITPDNENALFVKGGDCSLLGKGKVRVGYFWYFINLKFAVCFL
jgi:hypothetical protein